MLGLPLDGKSEASPERRGVAPRGATPVRASHYHPLTIAQGASSTVSRPSPLYMVMQEWATIKKNDNKKTLKYEEMGLIILNERDLEIFVGLYPFYQQSWDIALIIVKLYPKMVCCAKDRQARIVELYLQYYGSIVTVQRNYRICLQGHRSTTQPWLWPCSSVVAQQNTWDVEESNGQHCWKSSFLFEQKLESKSHNIPYFTCE